MADDIPEDVMEAATSAWQCADNRADRGPGSIEEIAHAIMSERERCAKLAPPPFWMVRVHAFFVAAFVVSAGGSMFGLSSSSTVLGSIIVGVIAAAAIRKDDEVSACYTCRTQVGRRVL